MHSVARLALHPHITNIQAREPLTNAACLMLPSIMRRSYLVSRLIVVRCCSSVRTGVCDALYALRPGVMGEDGPRARRGPAGGRVQRHGRVHHEREHHKGRRCGPHFWCPCWPLTKNQLGSITQHNGGTCRSQRSCPYHLALSASSMDSCALLKHRPVIMTVNAPQVAAF